MLPICKVVVADDGSPDGSRTSSLMLVMPDTTPNDTSVAQGTVTVGEVLVTSTLPFPWISQRYVSGSPSGSIEPPPFKTRSVPGATKCGPPALAVGFSLISLIEMLTVAVLLTCPLASVTL